MVATWRAEDQGEVSCANCGARYKRTVTRFPVRDNDYYDCEQCGHRMDEWNSTQAPSYEYIGPKLEGAAD
jgi:predicted nucleic acid-binding Zn ribbon protein